MYPYTRLRRTRKHAWLRDLVRETSISPSDLILPLFITEGVQVRDEINTMPDVFRLSIDEALKEIKLAAQYGIKAFALFPCVSNELKTEDAKEALNPNNLICRALKAIKEANLEVGIICDVALDPYTTHGHDGIVKNSYVDNDITIEVLQQQSLILAEAGADILAPSDMMDGRVRKIREVLEANSYTDIPILSYAAKYSSSFYGPFRDAVGSKINLSNGDKKTYQMDIRNSREALLEANLDIEEGADIIMVKPGMPYLDVITKLSTNSQVPIFAYQVSGEYAMLKAASKIGAIDYENALIESLLCLKRAGTKSILTYGAIEAARIISAKADFYHY
ncbi:MAG: porphobilinogen synthase [Rickettsiaceae bacterium]|nr:porphobilinogen synthase [Rickettsiaceae bacterium]